MGRLLRTLKEATSSHDKWVLVGSDWARALHQTSKDCMRLSLALARAKFSNTGSFGPATVGCIGYGDMMNLVDKLRAGN